MTTQKIQYENLELEVFERAKMSHKLMISIRKSGQIGISVGVTRKYDLKKYEGFVLSHSREQHVLGIIPTDDTNHPGFITGREHNDEIQVSAKSFFDYHGIPYDKTRRTSIDKFDRERGMILADISDIVQKGTHKKGVKQG